MFTDISEFHTQFLTSLNELPDFVRYCYSYYTANLLWNIFLTSAATHAIVLVASPLVYIHLVPRGTFLNEGRKGAILALEAEGLTISEISRRTGGFRGIIREFLKDPGLTEAVQLQQAVCKWYRRKCSDSDTPLPYVCALFGSVLWLRYSAFINDFKLVLLQLYAASMQIFFLTVLLYYRTRKRRLLRNIGLVMCLLLFLLLYAENLTKSDGKKFIGTMASGAQICGSFVCPYLIARAVQTKVLDFVPFAPVMFTWVMEIHAIIYSVGINDFYMLIANATFCIMDGTLLLLFFIYPTEKPSTDRKVAIV